MKNEHYLLTHIHNFQEVISVTSSELFIGEIMLEIIIEDIGGNEIYHSRAEVCLSFYWHRSEWNIEKKDYLERKYPNVFPNNGECYIRVRDSENDFREWGIKKCKWFKDFIPLVTNEGFLKFDTRKHSFWFMRFGVTLIRAPTEGVSLGIFKEEPNKAFLLNEVVEDIRKNSKNRKYTAILRDWNQHSQFRSIMPCKLPVGKLDKMMDDLLEISKRFGPMIEPDDNEENFKYPDGLDEYDYVEYGELFKTSKYNGRVITTDSIQELMEILEV